MAFKIGQLVQCINDKGWVSPTLEPRPPGPKKGDILTITEIHPATVSVSWLPTDFVELMFEEYNGRQFYSGCFRPLQETGMSILKAILANPHKQLETVE